MHAAVISTRHQLCRLQLREHCLLVLHRPPTAESHGTAGIAAALLPPPTLPPPLTSPPLLQLLPPPTLPQSRRDCSRHVPLLHLPGSVTWMSVKLRLDSNVGFSEISAPGSATVDSGYSRYCGAVAAHCQHTASTPRTMTPKHATDLITGAIFLLKSARQLKK